MKVDFAKQALFAVTVTNSVNPRLVGSATRGAFQQDDALQKSTTADICLFQTHIHIYIYSTTLSIMYCDKLIWENW